MVLQCKRAGLDKVLGNNCWSFVRKTKAELPDLTAQLGLGGRCQQESDKLLPRDGGVILSWLRVLGRGGNRDTEFCVPWDSRTCLQGLQRARYLNSNFQVFNEGVDPKKPGFFQNPYKESSAGYFRTADPESSTLLSPYWRTHTHILDVTGEREKVCLQLKGKT